MKKRSFEAFPNIFLGRFAHSNSPNMTYRLKKDHNKLEFSRIYIGNPSMTDGHSLPGESPSIPRPTVVSVHESSQEGCASCVTQLKICWGYPRHQKSAWNALFHEKIGSLLVNHHDHNILEAQPKRFISLRKPSLQS